MIRHSLAEVDQLENLTIGQAWLIASFVTMVYVGPAAWPGQDHHPLVTDLPPDDRATSGVDDEVIRVHGSGHDRLTKPGAGVDHSLAARSGYRVGGEHHACSHSVDHVLDHDRQRHRTVIDAMGVSVAHRPICPQRCPAAPDSVDHRLSAHHVEVGVLLTREARVREILRGRRGTYRHRRFLAEGTVVVNDRLTKVVGYGCREDC